MGNLDYVNELGAVAADVQRAYESIDGYGEVDFEFAAGAVNLPFAPVLPLEEAKSRLAALDVENRINIAGRTAEYLESVVKAYETGLPQEKYFTYPQTVFKVGSVVFIPMPFEIFSEISCVCVLTAPLNTLFAWAAPTATTVIFRVKTSSAGRL